jgi:hypothetical protein
LLSLWQCHLDHVLLDDELRWILWGVPWAQSGHIMIVRLESRDVPLMSCRNVMVVSGTGLTRGKIVGLSDFKVRRRALSKGRIVAGFESSTAPYFCLLSA